MRKPTLITPRRLLAACLALVFGSALFAVVTPVEAIPVFARRYSTDCQTCHVTPPKLNLFGHQFLANGLTWPDETREARPTSPVTVYNFGQGETRFNAGETQVFFQKVELVAGGRLGRSGASYFIEWLPYNVDWQGDGSFLNRTGRFEDLIVEFPLGEEFSIGLGQFRPQQQFDLSRRLSIGEPGVFSARVDGLFAISGRQPGLRVDYLRGTNPARPADGLAVAAVLPLHGEFTLNPDFYHVSSKPRGVYLDASWREGLNSFGGFLFNNGDRYLFGPVVELNRGRHFATLAGSLTSEPGDDQRRLSLIYEHASSPFFVPFVRLDAASGAAPVYFYGFTTHGPGTQHTYQLVFEGRHTRGNSAILVSLRSIH